MKSAILFSIKTCYDCPKTVILAVLSGLTIKGVTLITKFNMKNKISSEDVVINKQVKNHFDKQLQKKILEDLKRVEVLTRML